MTQFNPAHDGAHTSFATEMSYGSYLHLDQILTAQHPNSTAHDEMLFIIQHQTAELWMRLVIHELNSTRDALQTHHFEPAFKMLTRVARIFEQLNNAWDVLRTMTPSDYTHFRDHLGKSSGFQSAQYRQIEFILGNRNTHMLAPHSHDAAVLETLRAELDRPSLYDVASDLLRETVPEETSSKDAWIAVYRAPQDHWALYQLAEKLVDLEDYLRRWRFNHVTTVSRVIGMKRGTGGTSGTDYLKRMLEVVLFPDLWDIRTDL